MFPNYRPQCNIPQEYYEWMIASDAIHFLLTIHFTATKPVVYDHLLRVMTFGQKIVSQWGRPLFGYSGVQ